MSTGSAGIILLDECDIFSFKTVQRNNDLQNIIFRVRTKKKKDSVVTTHSFVRVEISCTELLAKAVPGCSRLKKKTRFHNSSQPFNYHHLCCDDFCILKFYIEK